MGKVTHRFTPQEDDVLREHYPKHGATWVALSGLIRDIWSPLSVRYRADKLKLRVEQKIVRSDSMQTLEAFRIRCEVDESGCWIYRGAYGKSGNPMVYLPTYPQPSGRAGVYTPQRAAYLLSGRRISKGYLVYQRSIECSARCCNPDHLVAGPRGAMLRKVMSNPDVLHSPKRRAQYQALSKARAFPAEVVRKAQDQLAAGVPLVEVAKLVGISETTVRVIRDGKHVHCAKAQSSIFNMARAA